MLLYKEQSAVVSLGSTPIWTNPNWTTPNWTYPIWTWSTPKDIGGSQRVLLKKMKKSQTPYSQIEIVQLGVDQVQMG